ncbi:MAG: hypothetical protein Q8O40_10965 [Chloroflexota bacterium]|nr:hypothetical protein [Chloroflexota bacterium]
MGVAVFLALVALAVGFVLGILFLVCLGLTRLVRLLRDWVA